MKTHKHILAVSITFALALVLTAPVQAAGGGSYGLFSVDSFFDVFAEQTGGPPYPSDPPIGVSIQNQTTWDGSPIETEIVALSLQGTTEGLAAHMVASDGGGGGGQYGIDSFFDVFYDITLPEYPADSFFDVFVEIDLPGLSASPTLLSEPQVFPTESFFDVFVEIDLPGLGIQEHNMRIMPGPGMSITNVSVGSDNFDIDSFFDVFTELSVDNPGELDPLLPIYTMRMTGSFMPEPTSLAVLALGGLSLARRRRRA